MNSNKFFEDYEKLKTVGQGAFGTATLYKRIHDGKQVVLKEVYIMDMDSSERKSALNEVEILSNLNHTNIIKYFGSFQKEGSLAIIMEYADGGNLAQLINAKRNKIETFTEKSILNIISQISAALSYMHSNKILHRDLKSANIFLNMNGNVKVGDFGISKMLTTRSQAQTVVGTPYYLSPEMCEGYDYNEKSDIWAMGCILYEMACLRRPFEAMTLPVLVQKIINCDYKDIPESYSHDLSQLVKTILQRNPAKRPPAKFIRETILPKIIKKNESFEATVFSTTNYFKLEIPKERSVLYKIHDFGADLKVLPQELPHKKIADFSVSSTHSIVVTADHAVFTWGENTYGQLGLRDSVPHRAFATNVSSLQEKKIVKCAAGRSFSIFLSEDGGVFSCGDGQQGCLGHGDWNSVQTPKKIETLQNVNISQVACGEDHVVALASDGKVYTWGSSKNGQLGQGHSYFRCTPLAIRLLNVTKIKNIFCGDHETVLLATNGQVLVSGSNNQHKLGVQEQDKIMSFTPIALKEKIKFVSVGANHTMMLTESGSLVAFGRNSEGQFGRGNYFQYNQPQCVKLKNKITMVACGLNFTVAVDSRNVLWFWGSCYKICKNISVTNTQKNTKSSSVVPLTQNAQENTIIIKDFGFEDNIEEVQAESVKVPKSILAFYSAPANKKSGNIIYAADIKIKSNNLFVLAHTTTPPPIQQYTDRNIHDSILQMEGTTRAPNTSTNLPNMMQFR